MRVPRHSGIPGNEIAAQIVRNVLETTFTGPEPGLRITKPAARSAMDVCMVKEYQHYGNHTHEQRDRGRMISTPSHSLAVNILFLDRT